LHGQLAQHLRSS